MHWLTFTKAHDIASFLGFLNFYLQFFPYFKQQVVPQRVLSKQEMYAPIGALTAPQDKTRVKCLEPFALTLGFLSMTLLNGHT